MSYGACDRCLRGSTALAAVGGAVEIMPPYRRPRRILSLEPERLVSEVGGAGGAARLLDLATFDPAAERERIRSLGVLSACRHRGDFPWPDAFVADPEPPWVLNAIGDASLLGAAIPSVAVVGARRADGYGLESARRIALESAAAGAAVVSGLALGVDCAAHRGALEVSDGMTIAVVGGGVDIPYPRANRSVHAEIAERGCVVSEMPPGTGVWRWSFPARNRLIAALSDVVTVVQAAEGSGSLHTADAALLRGVTVAAVPGRIDSELSAGSNRLIADGAVPVVSPATPAALLGLETRLPERSVPVGLEWAMEAVMGGLASATLDSGGAQADALRRALTALEIQGHVHRAPGGGWRLT